MTTTTVSADERRAIASYAIGLFASHDRFYSGWIGSPEDGHWVAVKEPLTPEVFLRALETRRPISGYIGSDDGATHVAAIDFDTPDGWDQARAVGSTCWDFSVPVYIERSRRGAHLWLVSHPRYPLRFMRIVLQAALQLTGLAPDPKIELRPGQDTLAPGQFGNALRMPTMPHQRTGVRSPLYDPRTGEPLGATLRAMLLEVDLAQKDALLNLAHQFVVIPDPKNLPEQYRPPRASQPDDDDESASAILQELWGLVARPGKVVKCPVHDDRSPSLSVLPDDRRVICHSNTCELNNNGHGVGTYQLRKIGFAHRSAPEQGGQV